MLISVHNNEFVCVKLCVCVCVSFVEFSHVRPDFCCTIAQHSMHSMHSSHLNYHSNHFDVPRNTLATTSITIATA